MSSAGTARRARWPWVVAVIVVVLVVLVVIAELVARSVVPQIVRSTVISELKLPDDQQIDVETPGMMLPQLISGSLDEVTLDSQEVTLEGITGSAHVVATGVPIRGGELGSAQGTVSIDESEFAPLLRDSGIPDAEISLNAPDVNVQGSFAVLGRDVPFGLTVTPATADGDLLLTPVAVQVGGAEIDLQALGNFFGDVGRRLSSPQRICIADQLPAGITITGLRIEGTRAVIDIEADAEIATDPAMLEPGTCPR